MLSLNPIKLFVTPRGVRGIDAWGAGGFNAPRVKFTAKNGEKVKIYYGHKGLDVQADPGDRLIAPFSCKIVHYGWAYSLNVPLRTIHLQGLGEFSALRLKLLYVGLLPNFKVGSTLELGEEFAIVQDVSGYWFNQNPSKPAMINHVHVEIYENGNLVDPSPYLQVS